MKHFNLIICLFLFSYVATAQNQSIDSLKKVLKTLPQDTNRINVLNAIATGFIQNNQFDSAFRYAKPSMDLAEKLQYQNGLLYAYHNLALFNFHIKEYKTGKFFLLKSLNAALVTHSKKNIANNYKELADLYQLQGNFKIAKECKEKFALYNDSLTKEENDKHAAELKAAAEIKEKEKADLAAKEAKIMALNDAKKQQIFYISLAVLLVLSILLVWLLISRSKSKARKSAELLEENTDNQPNKLVEKIIQPQKIDAEKPNFLQKIAEKEAILTLQNVEKPAPEAEMPVQVLIFKDEKFVEKIPEYKNITVTDAVKTEPEPDGQTIEDNVIIIENEADDKADLETEKIVPPVYTRQFSNVIFPTQLLYFTVKLVEEKVKLVWKTVDEENIAFFGIEKSVDNVQFINIETLTAKGFDGRDYETFDLQPLPGINYYRLEIIDADKNFIFSPTVQIEILPATTLDLICYPTHVKDIIMVTAPGGKSPVLVNIYDSIGKKEFSIEVPPVTTPIFLNSLATGTYTLQMKCQGKTVLQQLIKIA